MASVASSPHGRASRHERVFAGHPGAARAVRGFLRATLADLPPDRLHDAVTCAAELAANALRHSRSGRDGTLTVTIHRSPATVTVTVCDQGGADTSPHPTVAGDDAEGGRGLVIVAALADAHGFHRWRDGWASWFLIRDPSATPAALRQPPAPALPTMRWERCGTAAYEEGK